MRSLCVLLCFLFLLIISAQLTFAQKSVPSNHEQQDARISTQAEDPIVIEVIKLDFADARDLQRTVAPLLSKDGVVVAYPPTNSLIIKDHASIVWRLLEIIKGKPGPE